MEKARKKDLLAFDTAKITVVNHIDGFEYEMLMTEVPYRFIDTSIATYKSEDSENFESFHIATITNPGTQQIDYQASKVLGARLSIDKNTGWITVKNVYADIYVEINPVGWTDTDLA